MLFSIFLMAVAVYTLVQGINTRNFIEDNYKSMNATSMKQYLSWLVLYVMVFTGTALGLLNWLNK